MARHGAARCGTAWQGEAGHGYYCPRTQVPVLNYFYGLAWLAKAWRGEARLGSANRLTGRKRSHFYSA